jgi:hypothetical protein
MNKKLPPLTRGCVAAVIIAAGIVTLFMLLIMAVSVSPALAAQSSDQLRNLIGDEAVSQLETVVFQIQDTFKQFRYDAGLAVPAVPWQGTPYPVASPLPVKSTPVFPRPTPAPASTDLATAPQTTIVPASSPTPAAWMPPSASPLGSLDGEGVWSPYIQDSSGQTIAYRTYLQPDPSRPYAIVGVVAFDADQVRLHYVLDSIELMRPTVHSAPV